MKKRILLSLLFILSMLMINVFAIDGDGSEGNPFLITTQEELELISDFPSSNFKLMNDIVLEGEWVPLCQNTAFSGTLDGNGHTISDLYISTSYINTGFIATSDGATIKNISIETTSNGISHLKDNMSAHIGILVAECYNSQILNCNISGVIQQKAYVTSTECISKGIGGVIGIASNTTVQKCSADVSMTNSQNVFDIKETASVNYYYYYHCYLYIGGIVGICQQNSIIEQCKAIVENEFDGEYSSVRSGGLIGDLRNSTALHSYSKEIVDTTNMTQVMGRYSYTRRLGIAISGGIGNCDGESTLMKNCYAVGAYNDTTYNYGFSNIAGNNCFYDKDVSGLTDTAYGTPKSTLAMKMKATYTDAGWDFENVWGISSDKNDGYPYLLWEYEDDEAIEPSEPTESEESTASVSIVKAESTADSLTMVSCVNIVGEHGIESVGTTFIPLWLFTAPDAEILNIEHNNAEYNISNGDTFSATITGIPEGYCDMIFVGKSYIKMTNGEYTWSTAKSASVAETTLHKVD